MSSWGISVLGSNHLKRNFDCDDQDDRSLRKRATITCLLGDDRIVTRDLTAMVANGRFMKQCNDLSILDISSCCEPHHTSNGSEDESMSLLAPPSLMDMHQQVLLGPRTTYLPKPASTKSCDAVSSLGSPPELYNRNSFLYRSSSFSPYSAWNNSIASSGPFSSRPASLSNSIPSSGSFSRPASARLISRAVSQVTVFLLDIQGFA